MGVSAGKQFVPLSLAHVQMTAMQTHMALCLHSCHTKQKQAYRLPKLTTIQKVASTIEDDARFPDAHTLTCSYPHDLHGSTVQLA